MQMERRIKKMIVNYKLWVIIERYDEEQDNSEDITEEVCIGTFENKDEALDRVDELYREQYR